MKPRFSLTWNVEELARTLKVTVQDVKEYLTAGRRVSFIIERRLMWEHPSWSGWGSGRVFGEAAFLARLDAVAGFILADIVEFPVVFVFKVSTEHVKRWYKNRELNAAAKISRAGFHARLAPQLTPD